jgi:acetoin utilization deacetylase AcuC-like enzyme
VGILQGGDAEAVPAVTEALLALARKHCKGRLVSLLEGGYDLSALAACAAAHVRTLMHS